jgi:nucleotide-binding universal stress UspA family protein
VAQDYFHQVAARLQSEGVKVSVIVTPNSSPIELIYEIVASRNIDFIAMSAHGSSKSEQCPLARTSAHMASHTPVPLLIVQDLDREQISRAMRKRRYDSAPLKCSESALLHTN